MKSITRTKRFRLPRSRWPRITITTWVQRQRKCTHLSQTTRAKRWWPRRISPARRSTTRRTTNCSRRKKKPRIALRWVILLKTFIQTNLIATLLVFRAVMQRLEANTSTTQRANQKVAASQEQLWCLYGKCDKICSSQISLKLFSFSCPLCCAMPCTIM